LIVEKNRKINNCIIQNYLEGKKKYKYCKKFGKISKILNLKVLIKISSTAINKKNIKILKNKIMLLKPILKVFISLSIKYNVNLNPHLFLMPNHQPIKIKPISIITINNH
jgi:hypothetical protein